MSEYILDGQAIRLSSGEYVCEMIGWRYDRLSSLLASANDNDKRVAELKAELAEAIRLLNGLLESPDQFEEDEFAEQAEAFLARHGDKS